MNRITKKIVKYFLVTTFIIMLSGYIFSIFFLEKIYVNKEYAELKQMSRNVEKEYIDRGEYNSSLALGIIKTDSGEEHCFGPGKMMWLQRVEVDKLKEKDVLISHQGLKYITYKLNTDFGEIVLLKNYEGIEEYKKLITLTLGGITILAIIITLPVAIFLGKKFTSPILKLKKAAEKISKDAFEYKSDIKTGDEIEGLALSMESMSKEINYKYKLQREFIANVSHDFKTPLSIIRNYSEAISDEIVEGEEVIEFNKVIMEEVDRLNNLVYRTLELSKIAQDITVIKVDDVNLVDFSYGIYNRFKSLYKQTKEISIFIEDSLKNKDTLILGDEVYLSRVIYNFMDNALRHSTGDKITFKITKILEGIKVEIIDNGQGISSDLHEDIWDRYLKNKKSGGMGLGLSISKEILIKHGFSYGVDNLNKGCSFYFIIPKDKIL